MEISQLTIETNGTLGFSAATVWITEIETTLMDQRERHCIEGSHQNPGTAVINTAETYYTAIIESTNSV